MDITRRLSLLVGALLATASGSALAAAALDFNAAITVSGTGIGAKITVLTIQQSQGTTESGCVSRNGTNTADVVGASACPNLTFAGGNEKTGTSQTLTRQLGEAGITQYGGIGVVLNVNQADAAVLDDMSMQVFDGGTLCATIPLGAGKGGGYAGAGTGGSGSFFTPNADALTALNTGCGAFSSSLRVGLAANMSNASGGGETWYIANTAPPEDVTTLCVRKSVPGGSNLQFGFTTTNPAASASLLDGEQLCGTVATIDQPSSITENVAVDFNPPQISCDGGTNVLVSTQSVTLTVPRATTVVCTFTNVPLQPAPPPPPPPVAAVPTLSEWAIILLGMLLLAVGGRRARRRG